MECGMGDRDGGCGGAATWPMRYGAKSDAGVALTDSATGAGGEGKCSDEALIAACAKQAMARTSFEAHFELAPACLLVVWHGEP